MARREKKPFKPTIWLWTATFFLIITAFLTSSQTSLLSKDDIFTKLKTNNPQAATAVFTLDNPTEQNLSKTSLSFTFTEACGAVQDYQILIRTLCHERTYYYDTYQACEFNKTTGKDDCVTKDNLSSYQYTDIYKLCYKPVDTIPIGTEDYKIQADLRLSQCANGKWGYAIDWIPKLEIEGKAYEQEEWAWWNVSFNFRRNISCTNMDDNYPLLINGSAGIMLNSSKQFIWTICKGSSTALYYNNNTNYVVANDTSIIPFEVENGTEYDTYTPTSVWSSLTDLPYRAVYHFNHTSMANDSTANDYNGSVNGISNATTNLGLGKGYRFDSNADYIKYDLAFWNNASQTRTYQYYLRYDNVVNAEYIHYDYGTGSKYQLYARNNSNLCVAMQDSTATWVYACSPWTNFETGLVTVIFKPTKYLALFINKTLYQNSTLAGNMGNGGSGGYYGYTNADAFAGILTEVRMIDGILSKSRINQTYDNIFATSGYGNILAQEDQGGGPASSGGTTITLNSPANNAWTNNITPGFNFTAIHGKNASVNCTVLVNNTYVGININVANNTPTVITSNISSYGICTAYYWNVTCTDYGSTPVHNTSSTRKLTFDLSTPTINNFNINSSGYYEDRMYSNESSFANVTATDCGIIQANLTCRVEGILVLTNNSNTLTNNTYYAFNAIGRGNYSRGDNLSCYIEVWDNSTNLDSAEYWVLINNTPPTKPTNFTANSVPQSIYSGMNFTLNGTGSTDYDGDNISYFVMIDHGGNNSRPGGAIALNWTNASSDGINYYVEHRQLPIKVAAPSEDIMIFYVRANDGIVNSTSTGLTRYVKNTTLIIWVYDAVDGSQIKNFKVNISLNQTLNYSNITYKDFLIKPNSSDYYVGRYNITTNYTAHIKNMGVNTTYNITLNASNATKNYTLYTTPLYFDAEAMNGSNITVNLSVVPVGALNITIRDETTNNIMNTTNVTLTLIPSNTSLNATTTWTTTGTRWLLNLTRGIEYEIRYEANGYGTRSYYINITPSMQSITLYLLNSTLADLIIATVYDDVSDYVENATITTLRYFADCNCYRTVEMGRTNFEGKTSIWLIKNTIYYKFQIEYNGEIVYISGSTKVFEDEITFHVNIRGAILEDFFEWESITYSLNYTNATTSFYFYWSDGRGETTQGCLRVYNVTGYNLTLINETCNASATAQVFYTINASHNATYVAEAGIYEGTTYVVLETIYHSVNTIRRVMGALGLFLTVLILIAIAFTGVWSPSVMFMGLAGGFVFTRAIGLNNIGWSVIIGTSIIMIILGLLTTKRGG